MFVLPLFFFFQVIPVYFAAEVGIDKNKEIILQDGEGRKWTVDVTERGGRFSFSRGWHDFLIGTKMVVDSVVSFVSATGSTIEVQLVKRGPDDQALFKFVEKKEGRFELRHSFDYTSDLTREPEKFHSAINIENEDHLARHENGSRVSSKFVLWHKHPINNEVLSTIVLICSMFGLVSNKLS